MGLNSEQAVYLLDYIASGEAEQIESDSYEFIGTDESGADGEFTESIISIAKQVLIHVNSIEQQLQQKDDYLESLDNAHCALAIEYTELKLKRRKDKARIARLEQSVQYIKEYWNGDRNDHAMTDALYHIEEECFALLNESPQQSLAEIQAQAVLDFAKSASKDDGLRWNGVEDEAKEYAESLRKGNK